MIYIDLSYNWFMCSLAISVTIFLSLFWTLSCFLPYSTRAVSVRIFGGMFSEQTSSECHLRMPSIWLSHMRYNVVNHIIYYRLNVFDPPKSICWNLISNVMILGGGTLGRWLGHKGRTLICRISALTKETTESSLLLLSYEDLVKIWPSMNQEANLHQTLNLLDF